MGQQHFCIKTSTLPPTSIQDITPEERDIMQQQGSGPI